MKINWDMVRIDALTAIRMLWSIRKLDLMPTDTEVSGDALARAKKDLVISRS